MIYLKPFNESMNEDYIRTKIFEINGDISTEDMEVCFIDLMDNGIIKKLDRTTIVDRWTNNYTLTIYFNIFFNKNLSNNTPYESIIKYINFKKTRFLELFSIMFPNYKIIDMCGQESDRYVLSTRNVDTIKIISTIPLPR